MKKERENLFSANAKGGKKDAHREKGRSMGGKGYAWEKTIRVPDWNEGGALAPLGTSKMRGKRKTVSSLIGKGKKS